MTTFINTQTLAYPVYQNQIQAEYPNTGFPNPFVPFAPYQVVLLSPQPTYDTLTQGVREIEPVESGGQYMQAFEVYDLTPEQIQYNKDQLAQQNKNTGQQILTNTDWTAIPSVADPVNSNPYLMNQNEFFVYRSAVRDIVLNPTYDAVFPEEPVEIWSTEQP
jgi:hypothetical protein